MSQGINENVTGLINMEHSVWVYKVSYEKTNSIGLKPSLGHIELHQVIQWLQLLGRRC